ncbi:hypothetical protein D3C71_102780 [compost metagenome]
MEIYNNLNSTKEKIDTMPVKGLLREMQYNMLLFRAIRAEDLFQPFFTISKDVLYLFMDK